MDQLTMDILIKQLDTLKGELEDINYEQNMGKISLFYRDIHGNLHKLVIKSAF